MTTPAEVAAAAQLACLLEVSAPKPGNVSPGRHFHDTRYEDFLASAVAIGPALAAAGERPLGATILTAVEATTRWCARTPTWESSCSWRRSRGRHSGVMDHCATGFAPCWRRPR